MYNTTLLPFFLITHLYKSYCFVQFTNSANTSFFVKDDATIINQNHINNQDIFSMDESAFVLDNRANIRITFNLSTRLKAISCKVLDYKHNA